AEAARRRIPRILLEVAADNGPAQRLYTRHGFRPIGLRKNYYQATGIDAVGMVRDQPWERRRGPWGGGAAGQRGPARGGGRVDGGVSVERFGRMWGTRAALEGRAAATGSGGEGRGRRGPGPGRSTGLVQCPPSRGSAGGPVVLGDRQATGTGRGGDGA